MSVSDIICNIIGFAIIITPLVVLPIVYIIKDAKDGAAIISFKNFSKIFAVFGDKFSIYKGYIYYNGKNKIFVKFPFNPLAKIIIRAKIRREKKRKEKIGEAYDLKRFISALEKDIEKMSKESENYVAQARDIVERIGKE